MKQIITLLAILLHSFGYAQFNYNLYQYVSTDGTTFSQPKLIQDSADVPSMAMDTAGTLYLFYQNFKGCPSFPDCDKIVMRTSTDTGKTWSNKSLVTIQSFPAYTRPFDPTIILLPSGNLRLYYSTCTSGSTSLDSTCGTFSAISSNGTTFTFEPGERFGVASKEVIDPAVVYYKGVYHYHAPAGAPQTGAYHATSNDGLNFTLIDSTISDNWHNWTGNLMIDDTLMRFYGYKVPKPDSLWWASSSDGSNYSSYSHINVKGKDPSVFKAAPNHYILIAPMDTTLPLGVDHKIVFGSSVDVNIYPNPSSGEVNISFTEISGSYDLIIMDLQGRTVYSAHSLMGKFQKLDLSNLGVGVYQVQLRGENFRLRRQLVIE